MIKIDGMVLVDKLETLQKQIEKSSCLLHMIEQAHADLDIGERPPFGFGMLYDDAVDGLNSVSADLIELNNAIAIRVRKQKRRIRVSQTDLESVC